MLGLRPRAATALALLAGAGIVVAAAAPAQAERPAVPTSFGSTQPVTSTVSPAAATTERISGADRYATSVAASLATFPGPDTPDVVYLVAGENFPDAIVAGPVAAAAERPPRTGDSRETGWVSRLRLCLPCRPETAGKGAAAASVSCGVAVRCAAFSPMPVRRSL